MFTVIKHDSNLNTHIGHLSPCSHTTQMSIETMLKLQPLYNCFAGLTIIFYCSNLLPQTTYELTNCLLNGGKINNDFLLKV